MYSSEKYFIQYLYEISLSYLKFYAQYDRIGHLRIFFFKLVHESGHLPYKNRCYPYSSLNHS